MVVAPNRHFKRWLQCYHHLSSGISIVLQNFVWLDILKNLKKINILKMVLLYSMCIVRDRLGSTEKEKKKPCIKKKK
jgi:hypothetical protein